jgi:hypothetical protein
MLLAGTALWLAGHWHYAARHHHYKSPLAERIFLQFLSRRRDPTRDWAVPVADAAEPASSAGEQPRRWIRAALRGAL